MSSLIRSLRGGGPGAGKGGSGGGGTGGGTGGSGGGAGAGGRGGAGGEDVEPVPATLTVRAGVEHCAHCFDTLVANFLGRVHWQQAPSFDTSCEFPFFVTWNKLDRHGSEVLRGCIGTLSSQPLSKLKEYALTSALRDHRFDPMALEEVPDLVCRVSLLVEYEDADGWDDWVVGTHGILISFPDPRGGSREYSATYLPEVAPEQGWGHREAIDSLVRKAGCKERVTSAIRRSISLTRYKSSKARLPFADYCHMRGIAPSAILAKA